MKRIRVAALVCAAIIFAYSSAAKAADSLDEQIAALEKENATLKKNLRVEVLQKENAELRKRLNVTAQSEPKPQMVRASTRQNDIAGASSALAYAPPANRAQVAKSPEYYPQVQPTSVQRWSGLYIGGHAGMGFGNWATSDNRVLTGGTTTSATNLDALGAIAGGQLGYSWQIGHFVFGPEFDLSISTVGKNKTQTSVGTGFYNPLYPSQAAASINWLSTLRGRVGFAFEDWLFFGSGGLAIGGINFYSPSWSMNNTETAVGYAVGGGLEYAVNSHLALRAEYLRYQFPKKSTNIVFSS